MPLVSGIIILFLVWHVFREVVINEGHVQDYCNWQWGTICDDGFDSIDACSFCKQLGYNSYDNYDHFSL